jgi:hypothetical protein
MEDGTLDDADFKPRYARVRSQLHTVQEQLASVASKELDVDTSLSYVKHLLWNSHTLWETSDLDTKQRLQGAIFPDGLVYRTREGFGTPVSHSIYAGSGADRRTPGAGEAWLVNAHAFYPALLLTAPRSAR